jgi:hypothetical protein
LRLCAFARIKKLFRRGGRKEKINSRKAAKTQRTAFDSSLRLSVLASKKSKSSSAADVNFISRSAVVDRRKDPQIFCFPKDLSALFFLFRSA